MVADPARRQMRNREIEKPYRTELITRYCRYLFTCSTYKDGVDTNSRKRAYLGTWGLLKRKVKKGEKNTSLSYTIRDHRTSDVLMEFGSRYAKLKINAP